MSEKRLNSKSHHRKVNKKPSAAKSVIVAVIISLLVVIMAAGAFIAVAYFYERENPNISHVDDYVDFSTDDKGNIFYTSINADGDTTKIEDFIKNHYNFLVIGKDRSAFNTDVIIIASYDITNGTVSMMQIPRDTYVELPDKKGKIKGGRANALLAMYYNQAHVSGVKYSEALKIACNDLKNAFSEILGVPINHYVMMDLKGFVNIVDAIGGVDLYVPRDMKYNDPEQGLYINLKKGYQNLDGDKSEQFIRFRKGYVNADLGRVDAQKIFISAFIEKVQKSFNVDTIATIVNQVSKYVVTDVEVLDMVYFAKKALSVNTSNIKMFTLPGDLAGKYYVAYRDETFEAVNTYFNPFKVALKTEKFDPNGSFYDNESSALYGVYTKTYTGHHDVPTYSADNPDDIVIPSAGVVTTEQIIDTTENTDVSGTTPVSTDVTTEDVTSEVVDTSSVTDTEIHIDTNTEPEETVSVTSDGKVTDEPAETTGETVTASEPDETTSEPEETSAVEITADAVNTTEISDTVTSNASDTEEIAETTEAQATEIFIATTEESAPIEDAA